MTLLSQSAQPDYVNGTKQENTLLLGNAWLYLSAIWNYYADKYNTVGIRHHSEINIFEAYIYHKKTTLPNKVEQMDTDQRLGEVECSKYWRLIPTYKEAIWAQWTAGCYRYLAYLLKH